MKNLLVALSAFIGIIILSIFLTLISVKYQTDEFITETNANSASDSEYIIIKQGGFPLRYLHDNQDVSTVDNLSFFEDNFQVAEFILNIIFYTIFLTIFFLFIFIPYTLIKHSKRRNI